MKDPSAPAVLVEGLVVRDGEAVVLAGVTFSVTKGSITAILGSGAGPAALLRCLTGTLPATAGRLTILGLDATARWGLRSLRLFVPSGSSLESALNDRRAPEVLLLETPEEAADGSLPARLRFFASRGTAILFTTRQTALAGVAADRIGILARGRLVGDEPGPALLSRFRRIRYANARTESRTVFGTELDEFDAARVRVRGWGCEAVVSNFSEGAFERLRAVDGVENAVAEPMSLDEIVVAVAGEG